MIVDYVYVSLYVILGCSYNHERELPNSPCTIPAINHCDVVYYANYHCIVASANIAKTDSGGLADS